MRVVLNEKDEFAINSIFASESMDRVVEHRIHLEIPPDVQYDFSSLLEDFVWAIDAYQDGETEPTISFRDTYTVSSISETLNSQCVHVKMLVLIKTVIDLDEFLNLLKGAE